MHVAGLAGQMAPGAGLAKGIVGAIEGAPSTLGASAAPITDIPGQLRAVGYQSLPSKNGAGVVARTGESVVGSQPLAAHQTLTNQAVDDTLAKSAAGLGPDDALDYAGLKKARINGPGKVYDAARSSLPSQLTQDSQLQSAIAGVGDTASQLPKSPDVDGLKQTMLNQPDMTRDELFANIAQARDRASRFYASDQPDAHAMGDAYQNVANAYEDFVGRQLAANPKSPVSLADWQDARTAFAKNYTVQSALEGTSIRGSKIAALQRKDPERLTGELQLIAEQHNRAPLSSGFGPTTTVDGGVGASGSTPGIIARHLTGPALGAGIGTALGGPVGTAVGGGAGLLASEGMQSLIRRALGGSPEKGAAQARKALQDPRLSDFFNPQPPEEPPPGPLELTPPPGKAFEPHQPQLATGAPTQRDFFGTGANHIPAAGPMGVTPAAAGHPGDIPLMDLLSHGVEQEPAAELTAGPMGAPAQEGIPFQRNAAHEAGDLTTHEPTLMDLLENLKDHPAVMHQNRSRGLTGDLMNQLDTSPGVPEGIVTKNDLGGKATNEAINRDKLERASGQDRFLIDPDGKMWPVRGVEAADATAPKGSIIVQKGIGGTPYSILDRGGLPRSHANGLLNRALAGGHGMNLMDLLSGDGG
jgi:hypothetical protein